MKKKSNLTTIATWRGEVRQPHPHGHYAYTKHGQGNGAVAHMDDNTNLRGDEWVGIRAVLNTKKSVHVHTIPKKARGPSISQFVPSPICHGFPTAQPLVPISSWVQFLKHLFLPSNVFKGSIRTLPQTLHNSKRRRSQLLGIK